MTHPEPESTIARHFIELATRTLEDQPEIRDDARGELMGRLATAAGPEQDAELETALAHMAKVVPRRVRWVAPACWVLWLALLGIAGWQSWRATKDAMGMNYFGKPDWERLGGHLSAEEKEFVFARYQEKPENVFPSVERLKERHPDDPRFYEDYAAMYFATEQKPPPAYRETWQRLDPDNGSWTLREAGQKARDAVPSRGPVDEAHFAEALALFTEAAKAKHFNHPVRDLHRQRAMMLAEPQDMIGELQVLRFGVHENWDGMTQYQVSLGRVIGTQADRLASAKDPEGLRALLAAWERAAGGMAESLDSTIDLIMFANFLKLSAPHLESAARDLGMAAEEAELQRKQAIFSAINATFRTRCDLRPASYLAGMLGPGNGDLDPALLEPGRRVEYAMLDRGTALSAAVLLLLVLAGVIFEAYRRGRRVNGLAEGLAPLLRPVDGLWCLGLGIALPVGYYFIVNRLTPLGCRDWGAFAGFGLMRNPGEWLLAPAFVQPAAGLLLVLCCLVQVTRWRVARRTGFLALQPRWSWTTWLVPLLAAVLLPLSGIARWITVPEDRLRFLIAAAAASGLPLLWLLWQAVAGLGAGRDHALGGVLLSRSLLLPLGLLTALLLSAWLPLKQQEREWFLKDELTRSDRSHGGLSKWEVRSTVLFAKYYREAFGPRGSSK